MSKIQQFTFYNFSLSNWHNSSIVQWLYSRLLIKEEDHSIELQFQIIPEWKETRAVYHNLKPEIYLNVLSFEEINRLWLPFLVYTNTDQQKTTRFVDDWEWSTYVSGKREGNLTWSGYEMALVKALNFLPNVHKKGGWGGRWMPNPIYRPPSKL